MLPITNSLYTVILNKMGYYKRIWMVKNDILQKNREIILNSYISEAKFKKMFNIKEVFSSFKDSPVIQWDINNVFLNDISKEFVCDLQPTIMTKADLIATIKDKSNDIKDYYEYLLNLYGVIKENIKEVNWNNDYIVDFFREKINEWDGWKSYQKQILKSEITLNTTYPVDIDWDDILTKSKNYEYSIFELVRILKTTDFNNYTLIVWTD